MASKTRKIKAEWRRRNARLEQLKKRTPSAIIIYTSSAWYDYCYRIKSKKESRKSHGSIDYLKFDSRVPIAVVTKSGSFITGEEQLYRYMAPYRAMNEEMIKLSSTNG